MTETTIVAVVVAVVASVAPTLTAYAALRQGRKNGEKADTLAVKADEIHTLTNSNLAAVKADLALANQRIEALQTLVATLTGNVKRVGDPVPVEGP